MLKAFICQHLLHLCVNTIGICLSAVAHKADCGLTVIVLCGCVCDCLDDCLKIIITGQKRLAYCYLLKRVRILCDLINQIVVLQAIHQMSRLDNQGLYVIVNRTLECFAYVIDRYVISRLYMVNDDLAGKASSYGIIRECLLHCVLNCANGQTAAVVKAGSKADNHQLLIADLVLISCVVHRCISGVIIFFVFCLSLCSCFLCCSLCLSLSLAGSLCRCGCLGLLCLSCTACHHRSRKRSNCK